MGAEPFKSINTLMAGRRPGRQWYFRLLCCWCWWWWKPSTVSMEVMINIQRRVKAEKRELGPIYTFHAFITKQDRNSWVNQVFQVYKESVQQDDFFLLSFLVIIQYFHYYWFNHAVSTWRDSHCWNNKCCSLLMLWYWYNARVIIQFHWNNSTDY